MPDSNARQSLKATKRKRRNPPPQLVAQPIPEPMNISDWVEAIPESIPDPPNPGGIDLRYDPSAPPWELDLDGRITALPPPNTMEIVDTPCRTSSITMNGAWWA